MGLLHLPLTRKAQRFTLVELLLVIAVIMMLLAMLLPALAVSKERAAFARWRGFSASLRGDDMLAIYYDFEDGETSTVLKNRAAGAGMERWKRGAGDAQLSASARITKGGRFKQKGNIYFLAGASTKASAPKARWFARSNADKIEGTVMFWQKVQQSEITANFLFYWGNASARFSAHTPWSNSIVYFDYGPCCNAPNRITTSYTPYWGEWTHIALVTEGNGGNLMSIYVNGERVANYTGNTDGPDYPLNGLTLGSHPNGSNAFTGFLDEFLVYQRALSEDEIKLHYEAGRPYDR